jgi:hypothetical protein
MFIRYFLELNLRFDEVEDALLASPETWVPNLARDAEGRGEALLAEVGFGGDVLRVDKHVEIQLGVPLRISSKTILPLTWTPTGTPGLFPALEADVEVAALGPNMTQVSISARYKPPMGAVGRAVDKTLLHRVAEATVKNFLDGVGEGLLAIVASRSGARVD